VFAVEAGTPELTEMWLNRAWVRGALDPDRNPHPMYDRERLRSSPLPSAAELTESFDTHLPSLFEQCQAELADSTRTTGERPSFDDLAVELLAVNLRQWLLEDLTRDPKCRDAGIAATKRLIDRSNMARHERITAIDRLVTSAVVPADVVGITHVINSESIGYLVDRLSVWSLKRFFHLRRRTGDGGRSALQLTALSEQRDFSERCYDRFLAALVAGRGLLPPSGHFKDYGSANQ
jgi:hypothetical protein